MILRYIIFILIGFFLYHLIKKLLKPSVPERRTKEEASEMVLDQQCGRYILKNNALKLSRDEDSLYFCSEECLERYRKKSGGR